MNYIYISNIEYYRNLTICPIAYKDSYKSKKHGRNSISMLLHKKLKDIKTFKIY